MRLAKGPSLQEHWQERSLACHFTFTLIFNVSQRTGDLNFNKVKFLNVLVVVVVGVFLFWFGFGFLVTSAFTNANI